MKCTTRIGYNRIVVCSNRAEPNHLILISKNNKTTNLEEYSKSELFKINKILTFCHKNRKHPVKISSFCA